MVYGWCRLKQLWVVVGATEVNLLSLSADILSEILRWFQSQADKPDGSSRLMTVSLRISTGKSLSLELIFALIYNLMFYNVILIIFNFNNFSENKFILFAGFCFSDWKVWKMSLHTPQKVGILRPQPYINQCWWKEKKPQMWGTLSGAHPSAIN